MTCAQQLAVLKPPAFPHRTGTLRCFTSRNYGQASPVFVSRAKSGFDIQETIIYKDTHAQRPRQLRCPGPSGSHSSLLGAESLRKIQRDLARVECSAFPYVRMQQKPWSDLSWTPNVLESLLQSAAAPVRLRGGRCPEDCLLSGRVMF